MIVSYTQENWCKQMNAVVTNGMSVILKKTVSIGFFSASTCAKICTINFLFGIVEYEKSAVIFQGVLYEVQNTLCGDVPIRPPICL
jgi:hypothetical protein